MIIFLKSYFIKTLKILAILCVVIVLILLAYERYQNSNAKYKKDLENSAREAMSFMEYGVDKNVDGLIQFEADAEGWGYSYDEKGNNFIETENIDLPFFATRTYIFSNPKNPKEYNALIKSFIYSTDEYEWVPIEKRLYKFRNNQIEITKKMQMWQGDYDIPFFVKEERRIP